MSNSGRILLSLALMLLAVSAPAVEVTFTLQEPGAGFPDQRVSHLVVLDSGNWALAAHGPGVREALDLDRVHWRSTSGRRPWLAGTLPDRRCVLLDLDEIGMLAL